VRRGLGWCLRCGVGGLRWVIVVDVDVGGEMGGCLDAEVDVDGKGPKVLEVPTTASSSSRSYPQALKKRPFLDSSSSHLLHET